MKRHVFLLLVFSLFSATALYSQLPTNVLEGSWQMVSQKLVYPDTVMDRTGLIPHTIKILNSTHFAFGRQTGAEEIFAGGGSYEYHGDTYTEHIVWHSSEALVGQSVTFDVEVENDTWRHTGDLGDFVLEEVWERIDPEAVHASSRP